ncbi:PREDICTED: iron sulfur cluster assembly protein 1, mitochondrial-like [Acropora digitifera]|uniref:iron sulfur cluster assembly protein 1, mitochondrial-like n=1 Tax=Acropora digitifera TaxID=70779 RepID=UPI00077A6918|nr:PREDICTED: iron sulfur cluster assembly protein 1, mitochondrial-like [Acropora digitifera]
MAMAVFRHSLRTVAESRVNQMIGTAVASYHKNVIDHYENPRNVGSLDKDDSNVGTGLVGAPACGDVMKLQVCCDNVDHLTYDHFMSAKLHRLLFIFF